jgi:Uma2 family endonuclease
LATLVIDPGIEQHLLERRRASRGDRWDEVWDGVYIMAPLPNLEHQELVINLGTVFKNAYADQPNVRVFPGVNVSDREDDWEKNYRCPDVAIVLPESRAVDCGAYFLGGPDFVVEVASDYDRSREKFDFYAGVGVREFLLVDRNPWQLELYALRGKKLVLASRGDVQDGGLLTSQLLPLSFRLIAPAGSGRPQIEIVRTRDGQRWLA